jgi:YVTN family beta-propeller protein
MEINAQGNSVYVANTKSNDVSQYTINPTTGQLTPKTPATVGAGRGSVEIAVTPDGKSAFVVDHDAVSQYSINPNTGRLTPKSPATVATGRNAEPIAISPNGKYAYVANCPGCVAKLRGSHAAAPPKPTSATATIWDTESTRPPARSPRLGP